MIQTRFEEFDSDRLLSTFDFKGIYGIPTLESMFKRHKLNIIIATCYIKKFPICFSPTRRAFYFVSFLNYKQSFNIISINRSMLIAFFNYVFIIIALKLLQYKMYTLHVISTIRIMFYFVITFGFYHRSISEILHGLMFILESIQDISYAENYDILSYSDRTLLCTCIRHLLIYFTVLIHVSRWAIEKSVYINLTKLIVLYKRRVYYIRYVKTCLCERCLVHITLMYIIRVRMNTLMHTCIQNSHCSYNESQLCILNNWKIIQVLFNLLNRYQRNWHMSMKNDIYKSYIHIHNYFYLLLLSKMIYAAYVIISLLKTYYHQQYYRFYNIATVLYCSTSSTLTIMLLRMINNYQLLLLIVCFQYNHMIVFFTGKHVEVIFTCFTIFGIYVHTICTLSRSRRLWKDCSRGVGNCFTELTYDDYG